MRNLTAPEGATLAVSFDTFRQRWILEVAAAAPTARAAVTAAAAPHAQAVVDDLARRVLAEAARARYPRRARTSRPLERLEQVRAFLAADPDDPTPARWPCVVTSEEADALRRAVAARGGGYLDSPLSPLPSVYTGPAFDLEARKREVSGAPVLGEWAGTLLVGEP